MAERRLNPVSRGERSILTPSSFRIVEKSEFPERKTKTPAPMMRRRMVKTPKLVDTTFTPSYPQNKAFSPKNTLRCTRP